MFMGNTWQERQYHDSLSKALGMSTLNTYSIASLEKMLEDMQKAREVQRLNQRQQEELSRQAAEALIKQKEREDKLKEEKKEEQLLELMRTRDWDDMSDFEHEEIVRLFKKRNPNYFSNRRALYENLLSNKVGSIYANMNNVAAYLSSNSRPLEPGLAVTTDEDYYYDVLLPKARAILWWYEIGQPTLYPHKKLVWDTRITAPNIVQKTSLAGDEIVKKVDDNKYLVGGSIIAIVTIVGGGFLLYKL